MILVFDFNKLIIFEVLGFFFNDFLLNVLVCLYYKDFYSW